MGNDFFKIAITAMAALYLLNGCVTARQDSLPNGSCTVIAPSEATACTMQYDPVCGCDGKTYGNACMARGAGVPNNTPGACEEKTNN